MEHKVKMKVIRRLNGDYNYTFLGCSKKGNLHVGKYCDDIDDIKWKPFKYLKEKVQFAILHC